MTVLRDILIPCSMLRDPSRFGGLVEGDCLRGDLEIETDRAVRLLPAEPTTKPRMVIPALTEAHCHLDKCHSGPRLQNVGGDLAKAIQAQMDDKKNWSDADLQHRMRRGLTDLGHAGCSALRSHIDWADTAAPPRAWHVLSELAADAPDTVVQLAALTGIDQFTDREFCIEVARRVAATPGGVLGSFILHHKNPEAGLRNIFEAATHFGLALDFHVDEGLGELNGVEKVCDAAFACQFEGPVLCGHAVGLIEKSPADLARITDKILAAGISICALPTTNLYLQGRRDGSPDRRGLTPLRELHQAGVPIVVASDNVDDAFCPVGQHDPRAALHLAVVAAHLDPPLAQWLPSVTTHASKALGIDPVFVDGAHVSDLRLCEVATTADLVAGRAPLVRLQNFSET